MRTSESGRFLMHVGGFPAPPDILEPQTIRTMTAASAGNATRNLSFLGRAKNERNLFG
jgi:hypothetical protein